MRLQFPPRLLAVLRPRLIRIEQPRGRPARVQRKHLGNCPGLRWPEFCSTWSCFSSGLSHSVWKTLGRERQEWARTSAGLQRSETYSITSSRPKLRNAYSSAALKPSLR
jgi:hypothetical protein